MQALYFALVFVIPPLFVYGRPLLHCYLTTGMRDYDFLMHRMTPLHLHCRVVSDQSFFPKLAWEASLAAL